MFFRKTANMFEYRVPTMSSKLNEFTDKQFPTGLELFHEELRPAFLLDFSSPQTSFAFFLFLTLYQNLRGNIFFFSTVVNGSDSHTRLHNVHAL